MNYIVKGHKSYHKSKKKIKKLFCAYKMIENLFYINFSCALELNKLKIFKQSHPDFNVKNGQIKQKTHFNNFRWLGNNI